MPLISEQLGWLFILAVPVACIAWTVTHEEVFDEVHQWCLRKSRTSRGLLRRKFYYLLTCEYCFSHYVAAGAVLASGFRLLMPDWRGTIVGWFTLVWVANIYMSLYGRLRLDIKRERVEVEIKTEELAEKEEEPRPKRPLKRA